LISNPIKSDFNQEELSVNIQNIIGYYKLDPNKVGDILLEVLKSYNLSDFSSN